MGKRNRNRKRKVQESRNPYGSAGQAHDATSAATRSKNAAPPPDSPPGAPSSPAESNPYGPQEPLETADAVREAGYAVDLPMEAPEPGGDIRYSDGKTFFEKYPELLKGSGARPGA